MENLAEVPIQSIEKVKGFREDFLKAILALEKECFPAEWQYPNAEEYYKKILEDKENINIFLKEGNKIVGYILGKSFNKAMEYLNEFDPELQYDADKFYIETIQISPSAQNRGGSRKLLGAVCEEAAKKGIHKFAIHARTKNKFHDKIKKIFEGNITAVKEIEKWEPADNEPYEYIEWEYKK